MDVHVTGGAGFIGSRLVRRLVSEGHDVTVLDNVSRGRVTNLDPVADSIEFIEGDIKEYQSVEAAIDSPDLVYHLAAVNGTKNFYDSPVDVMEVNVSGVQNVIRAVRNSDCDRLVFASSSEVYGYPTTFPTPESHPLQIMDPTNSRFSYAGSKILGEQYVVNGLEQTNTGFTILRPHNVYGEAMGEDHVIPEFIEQIVTDIPFTIYGDGEQTRSFCYIDDAVDGFYRAGTSPSAASGIYNIGTQDEITINELAERLFAIAGFSPEVEHTDSQELEGSTRRRQPDISRARDELGYEPAVSLDEGLQQTFDWYCEYFTGESAAQWRNSEQ
ncbi:SDR family NAD(P)-dependent oxidoreductase [Halovenus sp. HT40]|uniref:SDR family NAD(P)-dependent oxidoreductase n=1 Tax=Halovenus sp. HT40 TaxID=3126691 RepID=UPI00300ED897